MITFVFFVQPFDFLTAKSKEICVLAFGAAACSLSAARLSPWMFQSIMIYIRTAQDLQEANAALRTYSDGSSKFVCVKNGEVREAVL